VTAAGSAVRLTLNFESKGADLVGGCIAGDCPLLNAFPIIEWQNGTVAIDVVPVRSGSSMALLVKNVGIGGLMTARCASSGDFFSEGACELTLPWANRTITRHKPDVIAMVKNSVNDPQTQAEIAMSLKKYLVLNSIGEIAITDVTSDSGTVSIKFRIVNLVSG
jgi:hypothetical protein